VNISAAKDRTDHFRWDIFHLEASQLLKTQDQWEREPVFSSAFVLVNEVTSAMINGDEEISIVSPL